MTPEERQVRSKRVVSLYLSGKTLVECGRAFGINPCTIHAILKKAKVSRRRAGPRRPKSHAKKINRLLDLREQGLSHAQIGKKLKLSRQRVYQILQELFS